MEDSGKSTSIVAAANQEPTYFLDDYLIYEVNDVCDIKIQQREHYGWDVTHNTAIVGTAENIYLYLDCEQDDAFGHWIFEAAFYLPVFSKLQKLYPNIKILSFRERNYKNSMYSAFNISSELVSYSIESFKNNVIFLRCKSLGDHINHNLHMNYIRLFYNELVMEKDNKKDIDILYLPRGTLENLKGNDRTLPCQSELVEALPKYFLNSLIYFTDNTKNIREQITLVRRAKILIVDYGSNLLFNGFFSEGTKILVIGDFGHLHCKNPTPYLMIKETLIRGCKYYYLPMYVNYIEVLRKLQQIMNCNEEEYKHKLCCWKMVEKNESCNGCERIIEEEKDKVRQSETK